MSATGWYTMEQEQHDLRRRVGHLIRQMGREPHRTHHGPCTHDVHFYNADDDLSRALVGFLADGLALGQPILVIATKAHRRAFADGLRKMGLDPDEAYSGRLAVWLDARETLAAFMEGGRPDRDLFMATVGSVFDRLLRKREYLLVRAYGEMVDLLCQDGNLRGALALEGLWNELADRYAYSLLCGYSMEGVFRAAGDEGFRHVLTQHGRAHGFDDPGERVA